jgi:NAD(P)H-hydrate epimerase
MKLVSAAEMQQIEREADASGLTFAQMMENAGSGLAQYITEYYGEPGQKRVLALVGSGNNGGDALVALVKLAMRGWQTCAYLNRQRPDDDPLMVRIREAAVDVYCRDEDPGYGHLNALLNTYPVLMDGILGTGLTLPLRPGTAALLGFVRQQLLGMNERPHVVAVDCPSGVDTDTGETAPETIPAELTVTMAAIKKGLLRFPAADLVGELVVAQIGMVDQTPTWQSVRRTAPDQAVVRCMLPRRPRFSHKGTFGTALVVAGCRNYTGAALLAGEAAYRAGAGLVTLAVPESLHAVLAGQLVEATWLLLPEEVGVIAASAAPLVQEQFSRATAVLIGPGLGLEETTRHFIEKVFSPAAHAGRSQIGFLGQDAAQSPALLVKMPPVVVDADGLKLLSRLPDWPSRLPPLSILTPHPGEMGVLTGLTKEELQGDRIAIAEEYAARWGHVVVLKGAFTVVASPDGDTAVIPVATPALARAGTGDVLAGLIVGLRSQGVEAYEAAVAGAWIHAQAGIYAAEDMGNTASVLARDVLAACVPVLNGLVR